MTPTTHALFLAIHNLAGRTIFADGAAIFFAEWLPYLLVLAFLVLVVMQKGSRRRMYLFAEGALAVILARGIVTPIIQFFYNEPRPFTAYGFTPLIGESGWSFPSAHMTLFFALAFVVWYANRKWGWWFLALSAIMGFARIYTGVHWPFDVIMGAVIGIACAMIVHWLLRATRKALDEKPIINGGGPTAAMATPDGAPGQHHPSHGEHRPVQVDSLSDAVQ